MALLCITREKFVGSLTLLLLKINNNNKTNNNNNNNNNKTNGGANYAIEQLKTKKNKQNMFSSYQKVL